MNDFQEMLETIRTSVHGQSHRKFQSRFGTSDVTQECAIQLINEFRSRAEKKEEPTITRKWLKLIGRGTAWKLRRKNDALRRSVSAETLKDLDRVPNAASQSPDAVAILNEHSASLIYAIGQLSPLERTVIDGHYTKQMSLNEIARSLGINRKKIQRVHSAALAKLKTELVESQKVASIKADPQAQ